MSDSRPFERLCPSGEFGKLLDVVRARYTSSDGLRIDEYGIELTNRHVLFDRARLCDGDEEFIEFVAVQGDRAYKLDFPIARVAKCIRLYHKLLAQSTIDNNDDWQFDTLLKIIALKS